jgi:predicted metal-dependent hydrolase
MLGFQKLPELSYQLVRSRKRYRSMSLQINHVGELVVSVPWHVSRQVVDNFVQSKSQWITKKIKQLPEQVLEVSSEKKAWCLANALSEFQKRVEYFSHIMQLYPTHLTVSKARTRWGSCTAQNHVRLNWRLMLLPPEILDAVVVHELAHIREKNHSRRFWMLVSQFDPNFREHRTVLKRHSYLLSL